MSKSKQERLSETKCKIQDVLMKIMTVSSKIQRELEIIDDIVKENGEMIISIKEANQMFQGIAKKQGIKSIAELLEPDDEDGEFNGILDTHAIKTLIQNMQQTFLQAR